MRFLIGAAIPLGLLLVYLYLSFRLRHPARKVSTVLVETVWLVLLVACAYHIVLVLALLWKLPSGLGPDAERNPFWAGFELPYAPVVQLTHTWPLNTGWAVAVGVVGMFGLLVLAGLAVRLVSFGHPRTQIVLQKE